MRHFLGLAALSCIISYASLATSAEPLPEADEGRLTLKGLVPGLELETAKSAIPGMLCNKNPNDASQTECGIKGSNAPEAFRTFGGVSVDILLLLFGADDKMGVVLTQIPSKSFEGLLGAMIERFGPPTSSEDKPLQNKMGAKFMNRTVTWIKGDDKLIVEKYGSNLNLGQLRLSSLQYEKDLVEGRRKSKAKDF